METRLAPDSAVKKYLKELRDGYVGDDRLLFGPQEISFGGEQIHYNFKVKKPDETDSLREKIKEIDDVEDVSFKDDQSGIIVAAKFDYRSFRKKADKKINEMGESVRAECDKKGIPQSAGQLFCAYLGEAIKEHAGKTVDAVLRLISD